LIPKSLLIQHYFQKEQDLLNQLEADKEGLAARQEELEEEHSGEDGYFTDFDKINKATVAARLKEIKQTSKLSKIELMAAEASSGYGEIGVLEKYLELSENQTTFNKKIREKQVELDKKLLGQYAKLTEEEIKSLIVEHKWMAYLESTVHTEMQRISQRLTQRIKELGERYDQPLPELSNEVFNGSPKSVSTWLKWGIHFEICLRSQSVISKRLKIGNHNL